MTSAELLPPEDLTLDAGATAIAARLEVRRDGSVRETQRTYYDTFDGLLYAEGLTIVHEDDRLVLVERETGRSRASAGMAAPAKPLLVSDLPRGPLREAVAPIIGVRALLALACVRSRERQLDVLDDEHKTVVRLALSTPALVDDGRPERPLRPRLILGAVRGYDDALAGVRHALVDELGFAAADQPLVDEAVRAAGGVPGGISAKVSVALGRGERTDRAAALVLARLLEIVEANLDGTIADIDSEFLHDLRVSVRRSRAVQREFKGAFPPEQLARFRGEFRWLQQVTGDSRDMDVYVLDFEQFRALVPETMRADLDALLVVLRAHRQRAHAQMVRSLRSARTVRLLRDWPAFLEGLPGASLDDRPDAARPVEDYAGRRIRKVYRQMVRMGEAIGPESPATDYHELRKKGKELRYLLELFAAPLYPDEVVKPMVKALKALQDVLGRHQDREVQQATLRSLRDEVASKPGGSGALMAMGALVQRLAEDEQAARGEFAARFADFASPQQRKLVKETFR